MQKWTVVPKVYPFNIYPTKLGALGEHASECKPGATSFFDQLGKRVFLWARF